MSKSERPPTYSVVDMGHREDATPGEWTIHVGQKPPFSFTTPSGVTSEAPVAESEGDAADPPSADLVQGEEL